MERWKGKVALVTGASSGIGKASAVKLLEHGMKVVGCSRQADELQILESEIRSHGELTTIPCDLTREEDVLSMFNKIKEKHGGVDVCVNSAGLAKDSPILSGNSEDWQLMFDVNVMGILRVTREAVAAMKAKGCKEGHIININSVKGHTVVNVARTHIYTATKFALTAITQGIRHELLAEQPQFNCRVSQISPGMVETPFVSTYVGEKNAAKIFGDIKILEADDIANTVLYLLEMPNHAQIQDVIMRPRQQQT